MKILIADDDNDLREMLETLLSMQSGYTVVSAENGITAQQALDAVDAPRLAILDWTMPGADGLDICKELRRREQEAGAPYTYVIILTGRDDQQDVVAGLAAGADDFITKPFDTEELERRVATGVRLLEYENKLAEKNAQLQQEISERERVENERLMLERSLAQARKAEALGTLAAGIAHEINTPIQFISDNIRFLSNAHCGLLDLVQRYEAALAGADNKSDNGDGAEEIEDYENEIDLQFLRDEIPRALAQSTDGLRQVTRIVAALRHFAHGGKERQKLDLNKAIEDAVLVSRSQWKTVADVRMDLDPSLPLVNCVTAEIKQALLNLIMNAGQAVGEAARSDVGPASKRGLISVTSARNNGVVEVRVSDNGPGIPEEIREQIFDPFFTTRDVGQGTGQGLTLAYASIVNRHGGRLSFETRTGKGTTFTISLPLE